MPRRSGHVMQAQCTAQGWAIASRSWPTGMGAHGQRAAVSRQRAVKVLA
eukprot:CAMPEP_0119114710 /NCGR_PEP_ID=MMETSP1180-20130426/48344_1 /TAXON_ID=3052 ORGANISM="Chlamydomonas cf sp, Strain CCMP681" /NCGR_SAMPLE_ID=MMETSP1180 /ASSEMBLY_ACC=CAM_ASM_000741 /LENGTH=48 /DNA_ID= /DNA_START= /DNA_END= /DNA_ORIENTATION=